MAGGGEEVGGEAARGILKMLEERGEGKWVDLEGETRESGSDGNGGKKGALIKGNEESKLQ